MPAVFLLLLLSCASDTIKAQLGEEFSLRAGQTAVFYGEDLKIKFKNVTEDSRCPRNVTCVWAGVARMAIEVTGSGTTEIVTLVEPGLTDRSPPAIYRTYLVDFQLKPYPEAGKEITPDQYRLQMTVRLK